MTRRTSLCFAVLLFVLVALFPVPEGRTEPSVRLGGTVKLYTSVFTESGEGAGMFPHEAGDFALTRAELWLKLNGYASDNVSFRARADFIYTANKEYNDFSDIEAGSGFSSEVQDFDINFREASFKIMDLFVPGHGPDRGTPADPLGHIGRVQRDRQPEPGGLCQSLLLRPGLLREARADGGVHPRIPVSFRFRHEDPGGVFSVTSSPPRFLPDSKASWPCSRNKAWTS